MIRQPMKAYRSTPTEAQLKFPYLASRKIDGIRAVVHESTVLSNTLKPIPNGHVQNVIGLPQLEGLDGELVVGDANSPTVFSTTQSGVMSIGGRPNLFYLVFDCWDLPDAPFEVRLAMAKLRCDEVRRGTSIPVFLIPHVLVNSYSELVALEEKYLAEGYEGLMLRNPTGLYKEGRTTIKENNLFKVKRFVDSEAEVIGFVEEYENTNVATVSPTGYSKRSAELAGMIPKGRLGALICRDLTTNQEFNLGSGFTADQRRDLWTKALYGRLVGKIVTYKHFDYGVKDAPRLPGFKGFRDPLDLSP